MCELMALSFAEPVSADFSLCEFAARGEENPDGWGLAWYPDGGQAVALVKEPVRWLSSPTAGFLSNSPTLASRIYLAHVRHKTVGDAPNQADTHPFTREVGGRDFAFAHNGTLLGAAWDLPLGRFTPVGDTDSERFGCYLLGEIERRTIPGSAPLATLADWDWLHGQLATANPFGKLNFLLSDGERLFVYHDQNAWKGLNFRRVYLPPGRERHFEDDDLAVGLTTPEGTAEVNAGFTIATCPLSRTGWHSFRVGELIVFDRGTVVYSSHRPATSPEFLPPDRTGVGDRRRSPEAATTSA